jgi:hypothetical protein
MRYAVPTLPSNDIGEPYDLGGILSLTIAQVAKKLGVSERTAGVYTTRGKRITTRGIRGPIMHVVLKKFKLARRTWVRLGDVADFVEECRAVEIGANQSK